MIDRREEAALNEFWSGLPQKAAVLDDVVSSLPAEQIEAIETEHDGVRAMAESIAQDQEFWAGVARKTILLDALPGKRARRIARTKAKDRDIELVPAGSPWIESSAEPEPPPPSEPATLELYDEFRPALYRFAYRFLQDRGRAEDVVQEVLVKAWRHPQNLDPSSGSPRAWLFTVARNILTDQWRADQARPRTVGDETVVESVPADDVFDRLVDAWQVEEAMTDLSADQRRVLQEVYYRGRSAEEAAEALGIPAGTVKSRTHYALRNLRAALERRGLAP